MNSNLLHRSKMGLLLLSFGLAVSARADVEDTITNSFKVELGGQLVMDVDRGAIAIQTAEVGVVEIEVRRKAGGSRSTAQEVLKNHTVTSAKNGNKVEVHAELKTKTGGSWFSFGRSPDLQVSYLVKVPRKFDVDLKTGGGHITISDLNGAVQAKTSGGNFTLERITGPITARTSGGHIAVANIQGNADLKTSGGNLTLNDITGDVTATTSGGHITAKKLNGKALLKTSGGNIELVEVKGPIDASTSGGHVSAELQGQPMGNCSFETSGGNITLTLPANTTAEIDAHTDGGRVSTDIPVVATTQGEAQSNELRGKINGGGPRLTAHTNGGHIRVRKAS